MNSLLSSINSEYAPILIDETSFKGEIDIDLNLSQKFEFNLINAGLVKYGLKLKQVKRILSVIVIKAQENSVSQVIDDNKKD